MDVCRVGLILSVEPSNAIICHPSLNNGLCLSSHCALLLLPHAAQATTAHLIRIPSHIVHVICWSLTIAGTCQNAALGSLTLKTYNVLDIIYNTLMSNFGNIPPLFGDRRKSPMSGAAVAPSTGQYLVL